MALLEHENMLENNMEKEESVDPFALENGQLEERVNAAMGLVHSRT
jgi:hypothetical protein